MFDPPVCRACVFVTFIIPSILGYRAQPKWYSAGHRLREETDLCQPPAVYFWKMETGTQKKTRKDAGMKSRHLRDPFRWIELHKDHHSQGWGGGGGSQSLQTAIAAGQCWHCYRHHIVVAIYKTADSGATRAKGSKEEDKIGTNQTQIGFFPLLSFFFLFIRPSLFPFSCGL